MPIPAYMTIKGVSHPDITVSALTKESVGTLYKDAHKDEILVEAFQHQVTIPTDPQSGMTTGERVHRPVIITKVFDKSSPLLYLSLCQNEKLEVEIKWYRPTDTGTEWYFTTNLHDAKIVDIKAYMPNCQDKNVAHFTHLEDISFSYSKISWHHRISKTDGEDSWREEAKK
jgi:type VI secretion system secreted protein Hcp